MKINLNWTMLEIIEHSKKYYKCKDNIDKINHYIRLINHYFCDDKDKLNSILESKLSDLEFEKYFTKDDHNFIYNNNIDINSINSEETIKLLRSISQFMAVLYLLDRMKEKGIKI